jgi:hypothetical protein
VDNVARVLAVIGVALAFLGLVWQAVSFYLAGGRVKVSMNESYRATPEGGWSDGHADGHRRAIDIRIANRGRLAVVMDAWSLETYTRRRHQRRGFSFGPPVSGPIGEATIEPGHGVTVQIWREDVQSMLHSIGLRHARLRAVVDLGTGKRARSSRLQLLEITVPADTDLPDED